MNSKLSLKTFTRFLKRRQGAYGKRGITPVRDWLIGLCIFSVIVIVGSIQSTNTFMQYQRISISEGVYEEKIVEYFKELGDKGLGIYTARQDAFTQLQGTVTSVQVEDVPRIVTATSSATSSLPIEEEVEEPAIATTTVDEGVGLAN